MNFSKFIKSVSLCSVMMASFALASETSDLAKLSSDALASDTLKVLSVYSIGAAGDHLKNQAGNNYNPKNMVDGDIKTAWALPYHSGEVILQFNLRKQATSVSRLLIYNGYGKNKKKFLQNSRAKKIGIYTNEITKQNLIREWELADQMDWQPVILNEKNVNSIFIRIHSVYPGTTWPDLCVSEVKFVGASSDIDATISEPEDWKKRLEGYPDVSLEQKLALSPAQVEQLSQNHYFVLTQSQKNLLHKKWDRDTLSILPSNWYDCSCFLYYVDWTDKDSVFVKATSMPSREVKNQSENDEDYEEEEDFGPFSRGLIMGIDGKLYQDGKYVPQRSYECVESGYSIDFPPVEVVGEKGLKKLIKNLIKAGLKFCEMKSE